MEKCGFIQEGFQRRYWHTRNGYYDRVIFGLLKSDITPERLSVLGEAFTASHLGWINAECPIFQGFEFASGDNSSLKFYKADFLAYRYEKEKLRYDYQSMLVDSLLMKDYVRQL